MTEEAGLGAREHRSRTCQHGRSIDEPPRLSAAVAVVVQPPPKLLLQPDEDRSGLSPDGRLRAAQGRAKQGEIVMMILQPYVAEQGLLLRQRSVLKHGGEAPGPLRGRLDFTSREDRLVESAGRIGVLVTRQPVIPSLQDVALRCAEPDSEAEQDDAGAAEWGGDQNQHQAIGP